MILCQNNLVKIDPKIVIPFTDMKVKAEKSSYGLAECSYDIRIAQEVSFPSHYTNDFIVMDGKLIDEWKSCLVSSIEEFNMPNNVMGMIFNKSTWAREGIIIPPCIIEPGYKGNVTLRLSNISGKYIHIPAGEGIASIIFMTVEDAAVYAGKYQNSVGIVNAR